MYNLITISDVALKKRGKTTRKDSSLAKMHLTKDSNDFKEFRENMKWKTKTYVVNSSIILLFWIPNLTRTKTIANMWRCKYVFFIIHYYNVKFWFKKDTDFSELKQLEVYVSPPKIVLTEVRRYKMLMRNNTLCLHKSKLLLHIDFVSYVKITTYINKIQFL